MKTFFTLAVSSLFAISAFAQSTSNPSHMFEFNADSVLQGTLNLDKSNSRNNSSDNDTQLGLDLNYAYALPMYRNIQLGARLKYIKGTEGGRGDYEDYGGQIGAIYNFSRGGQEVDLMNSIYTSLYLGYEWANNYSAGQRKDEVFRSTLALGKRFELSRWGVNHLVYSPEIALQNLNSKTGSNLEYSQSIQLRFLQFSVLF